MSLEFLHLGILGLGHFVDVFLGACCFGESYMNLNVLSNLVLGKIVSWNVGLSDTLVP